MFLQVYNITTFFINNIDEFNKVHYVYENQHHEKEAELKLSKMRKNSNFEKRSKISKNTHKSALSENDNDINSTTKSIGYDCEKGLRFINNELSFENTFPSVDDFFGSYCNNDQIHFR